MRHWHIGCALAFQASQMGSSPVCRFMRICDLKEEEIVIGLRIKSLDPSHPNYYGTIVKIDKGKDNLAWVQWDGKNEPTSGFYENDCQCEIEIK